MNALELKLEELFARSPAAEASVLIESPAFSRTRTKRTDGVEILTDRFGDSRAVAAFLRVPGTAAGLAAIILDDAYLVETCPAGGWLLSPGNSGLSTYWIPQPPQVRQMDQDGHVLSHRPADIHGIHISPARMSVEVNIPKDRVLDIAIWRLPEDEAELVSSLRSLSVLERQRYFLWSSHTAYERPADLYLHLVHGHVYENHEIWPRYWRICSELDAYALYLVLSGLERASGKRIYALLKRQIVFSAIARQAKDGGWYHGEWTDRMESHYRLHTGGTLMLADYLEESADPIVRQAIEKAVAFSASGTDTLRWGAWFLHDSLERSPETAKLYPFRWIRSRAFGKAETNMLILNTHLDTSVALERYQRATGDARHAELVASARHTSRMLLEERPADWLYAPLFRAIYLTLLPKAEAAALPLPLRAIKRIAWKYLIPLLPHLKALLPRLVMPGGYIDRSLSQVGMSSRYQPVNLMDLVRARRIFGETGPDALLATSFAFTQQSGIRSRWKEMKGKEDDSLGFWAEALYHMCLASPEPQYRAWLAEALIDLEDNGLGLTPSLLGGNREAVPNDEQMGCPSPMDIRLRVANLGRKGRMELVVVNAADHAIALEWETPPALPLVWHVGQATASAAVGQGHVVPSRGWLRGISGAPAQKVPHDRSGTRTGSVAAEEA